MGTQQETLYFDDLVVGEKITVGTHTVTEEELITFSKQFDPQPFHLDKEAAEKSIFGGIIGSGWHTCAIMMRLMVDGLLSRTSSMGSPGIDEIRWLTPVRGGDTLTVSATVLESRPSKSKPDRGIAIIFWEAKNQHGDVVATIKGLAMFGCKPSFGKGCERAQCRPSHQ